MSKVLYITANVKTSKDSYSLAVGEEFIAEYKKTHPKDSVINLDLYKSDVPFLNEQLIDCMFGQISKNDLDDVYRKQFEALEQNLLQFMNSDKYVFATPLWNLGVPPILKAYFDCVTVSGKTFKFTEKGPVGLLSGKKAMCIQASGGIYSSGTAALAEHGISYLRSILHFLGISDISDILIEGVHVKTMDAGQIKADAILKAKTAAGVF